MQQKSEVAAPLPTRPPRKLDLKRHRAKALIGAIVVLVGISAVIPFSFSRYEQAPGGAAVRRLVTTHDLWMHLHIMEQFDKVLRSGVIYPRWIPDINHGYGILNMIYYPPGLFYLSSAVHAVFNDWMNTLFVITALALVGSGFAFYFLARSFYGVLASAVAAVLYMILPMHMLDLYWRGGLPSFIGYIFPPLTIYFAYKLGREGKPRHYAGLALFYAVHLLTHFPVSLMFTYALAFYAAVWAIKERDWRIGARLAGAMALGLLASAIYWLPAALETRYAYEYATQIFPYDQSYITLLPFSDPSLFPDFFRVLNNVFVVGVIGLVITIAVLRRIERRDQSTHPATHEWTPLRMWIVMAIVTTFMSTSFSIYISRLLPKLPLAVPAWRWLALAAMFTSLLVAAAVDALGKRNSLAPKLLWACRAALVVVIAANVWFSIRWTIIRPLSNPTYYPVSPVSNVVESSWTPKDSTHPQELEDTQLVLLEPEGGVVEISRWEPQEREVQVRVDKPSIVRLKTYNFPGWTARIDGKVVAMLSDKDGVQRVEVSPGLHAVRASFENTGPRTAGTALSALAALVILGLGFAGRLKDREVKGEREHLEFSTESPAAEGSDMAASVSSAEIATRSRTSLFKRAAAIALVMIAVTAVIVMTVRRSDVRDTGSSGTQQTSPSDRPVGAGAQGIGSDAQLYLAGRDSVMVAVDEKAVHEMISAISGRDQQALEALIASGRAMKVNNNTRVRVLETMTGQTKVRILEGPHLMAEGWVSERWLR